MLQVTARGKSRGAAARPPKALSKESVAGALARDATFGYGRVRRVILALARSGADGPPSTASSSDLRALLSECANAHLARTLAPVEIPAAIAGDYDGPVARIRALAESAPNAFFSLDNDPFNKDLAVCLGQLYPGGARLIDLRAALPRRLLLLQRFATVSVLRFLRDAGGFAPWFQTHIDIRDLSEFNEAGLIRTYLRVATLLEANPQVRGVFGESWFYDPRLETLSPHLAYLQRLPRVFGARLLRGRTNALSVRRALLKSNRRREAYEQGTYRPQTYFLVWPRREILRWARARSSEVHGGTRD